ncbi:centromere-associated protein E, partial [Nephila pilipes]
PENECYLPGLSTPKSEKIRALTEKVLHLEKEHAELQEFTRLEKQIMTEDHLHPNVDGDKEISSATKEKSEESNFHLNMLEKNESGSMIQHDLDTLEKFPCNVESPECPMLAEDVKPNEILKTGSNINSSTVYMNEEKEEILQYLESTVKILGKRKHIDSSPLSDKLCSNYKIMFDMFNLILQYQCSTFQGCFKSELSKKIYDALDDLNKIFETFNNHTGCNETIEDMIENFMNKTDYVLKEIEMCSLDADDDKNTIMNQSRPFESFCDLPSFEKSFIHTKSPRFSIEANQSDHKEVTNVNISNSVCDPGKIEETKLSSDNENKELKNKILTLEGDIEKYLKTISDYKYNFELKDKQISILKDKVEIQKQMIDTFENELALKKDLANKDKIDVSCNTVPDNVTVTFTDQACQITYMREVSLTSSSLLNDSIELKIPKKDTVCLSEKQQSNFNKSLVDNEISQNKNCEELPQQDLQTFQANQENVTQQIRVDLEATLSDLSELKLFTLEFMKSEMKKEYLKDIESFSVQENCPLQDQVKIEITALKEMLMRLRFYLQNQNESTEYFNTFLEGKLVEISNLEDKLKLSESVIGERDTELKKLEDALITMEIDLSSLIQKLKSVGSFQNKVNFDWEDDFSFVINASKALNCVISIQKIISEMDSVFNKKAMWINALSEKLKDTEEELIVLKEKEKNFLELIKSMQAGENQKYLELLKQLEKTETSKEKVEDEFKNIKSQLESLMKEKECLQEELDSKITFFSNKIEDLEIKYDAEKQEWTSKTEECVKKVEEKCDQMLIDQENKFFDEVNKINQEHRLQLLTKSNDNWQQWQLEIEQLNEQHQKNLSEIKNKLSTEIDERYKEKAELESEIRNLKNYVNQLTESKSHIKNKCKQLIVELQRQKEKVKLLVQKENAICIQEKTNEKPVECKNTRTDILCNVEGSEVSSDFCNQCKIFLQQISNLEQQLQQKTSVEVVKESEDLYKRLQNDLEAKKAKIISLNTNNVNMVKEIMTLKKELTTKASLLRNCRCRIIFKSTENQNSERREDVEKEKCFNLIPESKKEAKPTESKSVYNSEDILQMDIVQGKADQIKLQPCSCKQVSELAPIEETNRSTQILGENKDSDANHWNRNKIAIQQLKMKPLQPLTSRGIFNE